MFNYVDHLGNVRLSYQDLDNNGILGEETFIECTNNPRSGFQTCIETTVSSILEENHYYPFGLKHEGYNTNNYQPNYKYKFIGQEWQDELGLNVYDFDNRVYDPADGRFWQMDPLAEQGRRWSPYNYCFDNPVYFQDPDGMWPWPTWSTVKTFANSVGQGFKSYYQNAKTAIANAPARIAQGYSSPKEALKLAVESHPLVMAASQFNAPINAAKSIIKGDIKGAGKAYGEHLAAGSVALATEGTVKAVGNSTKVKSGTVATAEAEGSTQTLYRGVNSTSPAYENATQGTAVPKGGTATAAEHNMGNTNSNYTSWTTNPEVAKNYALRTSGEGVIMEIEVPTSSTVTSPSVKSVNLKQSPGTIVNESEVLMKGTVTGAKTKIIN